jgi:hypothetical protein
MARYSNGSPARIARAEQVRKALELRKAGASYEAIARECGFRSRSSAYEAVMGSIRELTQEPAAAVLILELERLDRMLFGIWEQARSGQVESIDRVLKIMDRRRAIYGLDQRPPTELQGDLEGMTAETAARILDAAAGRGNGEAGSRDAAPRS